MVQNDKIISRIDKRTIPILCRMCKLDIYKEGVDRLYKFISFGTDKELDQKKMETLKNKQLFASSPLFFNDPYDCELSFNFMDNFDEFLEMVVKVYQLNRAIKET